MQFSNEQIMDVLKGVIDPNTGKDLVTSKVIKNLKIDQDDVYFDILLEVCEFYQIDYTHMLIEIFL